MKGTGEGGFDPSLENWFLTRSFEILGGERPREHAGLASSSWNFLDASAQQTSAQVGSPLRGGLPVSGTGQARVPARRLGPWGMNRIRATPASCARLDWCCPSRPRSAGEVLATRIESKGGQRLSGVRELSAEEPQYLSQLGIDP